MKERLQIAPPALKWANKPKGSWPSQRISLLHHQATIFLHHHQFPLDLAQLRFLPREEDGSIERDGGRNPREKEERILLLMFRERKKKKL
jgi:hypothetical protein